MTNESRTSYGFALAVWISPWLLLAVSLCLNQELVKIFTTQPGLLIAVALLVWESIGCFLLTRGLPPPQPLTSSRGFYVRMSPKVVLVGVVFVLPAFLLPMLAPVLVALIGAGVAP